MINSVLVANRGEIASRVFRTCRARGIGTVAVFEAADASSPHVSDADCAVEVVSYRSSDALISAALSAGADAVHPGYGFLSENASFAADVEAAGLTWIGPPASSMAAMASKVSAKELMANAGVPVLSRVDPATATDNDLPLLVKASAGGGGRGMRIVRTVAELPAAVESASREASSAFGDGTVFCERYVEGGHHVEVQVMADFYGTVWTLGERDCSVQRRHQKVIEQAPSAFGDELRERLLAAGRNAASAVGYVGAGTVEFLVGAAGEFWFLEMNTRLQVEHPVTEFVTGVDLVGLQLDVADGCRLDDAPPAVSGYAVQARLYAEDPADDWRPQTGTLLAFDIPAGEGIRVDAGVAEGSVVGTRYDGMLAKVIAYSAVSREAAARRLAGVLQRSRIHGVVTNRDLLVSSLLNPVFLSGEAGTDFYTRFPPAGEALDPEFAALAAALSDAVATPLLPGLRSGFRNVPAGYRRRVYAAGSREIAVRYRFTSGEGPETVPGGPERIASGDGPETARGGSGRIADAVELPDHPGVTVVRVTAGEVVLEIDRVRWRWRIERAGDQVMLDGARGSVTLRRVPRFADPAARLPSGALVAPMPGTVIRVAVAPGDTVSAGQALVWLEAMKMEHAVHAPAAGVVTALPVTVGQQVTQGTPLAVVDAGP